MRTSAMRRPRPSEPPRLALSIQVDDDAGGLPADRAQLRRWVRGALERDAMLTLRFVGVAEGRALNEQFRGRDYATNVLTFAYDDPPAPGEPLSADIVVCMPVVLDEARAQGKTARDHLAHLVVHGTLHAQGHDHEDDDSAQAMESLETAILRRFRIADPYR